MSNCRRALLLSIALNIFLVVAAFYIIYEADVREHSNVSAIVADRELVLQ